MCIKMVEFDETDIMHSHRERQIPPDEYVTSNISFAFALSSFTDMKDIEEDRLYATVEATYRRWGFSEEIGDQLHTLESHYCSPEELGLVLNPDYDENSTEYKIDFENRN